jgi:hypothetical protein
VKLDDDHPTLVLGNPESIELNKLLEIGAIVVKSPFRRLNYIAVDVPCGAHFQLKENIQNDLKGWT